MPANGRRIWSDLNCRRLRFDGVQKLRACQEYHPCARQRQQPAAHARIGLEVVPAALYRADGDCIGHQPRFEARLYGEKAAEFSQR